MGLEAPTDRGHVPPRVLELVAAAAGCELSPRQALSAAAHGLIHADDWPDAIARATRRAGLKVASFRVEGIDELERMRELEMVALTRVGDRWLVLRGARRAALDLTIVDELGEQHRPMRPAALLDWLVAHTPAALPMRWLVVEPRQLLASVEGQTRPLARLLALARLERSDLGVVVVHALAIGAATLAVPIAVQALVNGVATSRLLQPLIVLGLLLLFVLGFVAILRVSQAVVVERIQQRLFARVALDFARRLPRLRAATRERSSGPELVNRFFDVVSLQKTAAALLLDGSALVLQITVGLLLLAFYHPWLLAFDLALILGIAVVLVVGRGAMATSLVESDRKYAMAAWLEDIAAAPLRFADARSRSFADARAEILLREWLAARGQHFRLLLRHFVGGIGLQVASSVGLLAIGGWLVIEGQLTLGQLVAAELVVALIGAGLGKLGKHLENFYDAATSAEKLGKLLDLPLEPASDELLPPAEQPLAVELSEPASTEPLVVLAPGERLGLVGCTLAHAGLLDTLHARGDASRIRARLDGHEVERLDHESVRDQVALVRGAELVAGTVLDNLDGRAIFGAGEDLDPLLDRVDLRERLLRLPQGLDTVLLPQGSPLDRVAARRLALVRALATRPRLLLIDRGLDGLGLDPSRRQALLDWIFDRHRPWTLIVASEDEDLLARCDRRFQLT
jgi:putative ABC transport system ATP-binding protein